MPMKIRTCLAAATVLLASACGSSEQQTKAPVRNELQPVANKKQMTDEAIRVASQPFSIDEPPANATDAQPSEDRP